MRLDKLIEKQLQTSRKQMKRLFLSGKVRVDGQIELRENRNVDSKLHEIEVSGERLVTEEHYFLMNKPAGIVTANHDHQHQTVLDLLAPADRVPGIYSVGRLDRDTTGLVLLTNNGPLGFDLLHPTRKVSKVYQALVNELVTEADVLAFAQGIVFTGGEACQPAKLVPLWYDDKNGYSQVQLTIAEGKFHQVKKMFLARGKKVVALKRIALGPLNLPADLPVGGYRPLSLAELGSLKPYFLS